MAKAGGKQAVGKGVGTKKKSNMTGIRTTNTPSLTTIADHHFPGISHSERARIRQQMAAEVKCGTSVNEVASKYGRSLSNVRIACVQYGVDIPPAENYGGFAPVHYQILKMMMDGKSDAEIVKRFKKSRQRVNLIRQYAKQAGVLKG